MRLSFGGGGWLLFLLTLLLTSPILAQDSPIPLDPFAAAQATLTLADANFVPNPQRAALIGGGEVNTVERDLGAGCVGFIHVAPDARVSAASFPLLRFIFIADTLTTDTALVVRDPAGNYFCNNNTGGIFNPTVDSTSGLPGDYAVWVAGFTPNAPVYGALYVTSDPTITAGATAIQMPLATATATPLPLGMATPVPPPGTFLDPSLPAIQGEATIAPGFLPDPLWRVVVAGGALAVPTLATRSNDPNEITVGGQPSSACAGFTESAPDFRLNFSGAGTRLRFLFRPGDGVDADTSLIIRAPDGTYACSRAFAPGFRDPMLEFTPASAGAYDVWVAVESGIGALALGVLYVTEKIDTPETIDRIDTPAHGALSGLAADSPAYYTLAFNPSISERAQIDGVVSGLSAAASGAVVDIAALNPIEPGIALPPCEGFYTPEPTARLALEGSAARLRVFFASNPVGEGESPADPTLIVRMPDGRFYCGDDSFSTLDPNVDIVGNLSTGAVAVWVGRYTAEGFVSGALHVTQGEGNPSEPLRASEGLRVQVILPTPTYPLLNAADFIATPTPEFAAALAPTETAFSAQAADGTGIEVAPTLNDGAGILQPDATPNYGETALLAGFGRQLINGIAGGTVDARLLGAGCAGYITAQPDYRVYWSGGFLRVFFNGGGDSTMVIRDPNGAITCADDSGGTLSPSIDLAGDRVGGYAIWIGSYEANTEIPGTLVVTDDRGLSVTGEGN